MVVIISGGLGGLCSMVMGADFGSGRVGLVGLAVSVDACDDWFATARASSPISTSTAGLALITFFLMIFTTFSPSCCSPSVDRSDDDFVTVRRMIFFTILFTFTGGGGEVANEVGSSAGCDVVPFSATPFVVATTAAAVGSGSVFDSIITEAEPFVIGFGLSIGFALLIAAGSSGLVSCSSDFTSLLFSSNGFTFFS